MNEVWKQNPFLQLLFPLVAGIVVGWFFFPFRTFSVVIVLSLFLGVLVVIYLFSYSLKREGRNNYSVDIFLSLFLTGCVLCWWNREPQADDFVGRYLDQADFVDLQIVSPVTEKTKSWKVKAAIKGVRTMEEIQSASGHAFLYFEKGENKPQLGYGDRLIIPNRLEEIKNSGTPGEFDYANYCKIKNVQYSCFLPNGQWKLFQEGNPSFFYRFVEKGRARGVTLIDQAIPSPREAGLAKALLLGYRDDLEDELLQAYADVGVIHLIAISGLHVGLVYLILLGGFRLFWRKKKLRGLKGLLMMIGIWIFTLITGAHPSTLRAALMLSFLIAGTYFFDRSVNSLNLWAASAFVLLCFNPFLLFDVGFQLSYLAVAGILLFYPAINNWFWFSHKIGNYIWQVMAVSFAAQILTFPLVLYYFHQFPLFFLLANLVMIPAATVALYGEIILVLFSFVPAVMEGLGFLLSRILWLMNTVVLWAADIPSIKINSGLLHPIEVLLLFLLIFFVSSWIFWKIQNAFLAALGMVTLLTLFNEWKQWNYAQQELLIVYQIPGKSALEYVKGKGSRFLSENLLWEDPLIQKYNLAPSKRALGIRKRRSNVLGDHIFYDSQRQLIIINTFEKMEDRSLPVKRVILSKNNRFHMQEIKERFSPEIVVFDASVRYQQKQKWKSACNQLNLHCYSVADEGTWIASL